MLSCWSSTASARSFNPPWSWPPFWSVFHAKFGLVETGPVHPGGEIGVRVFRVPHVLAVVRVDACVCVRHVAWRVNGLPSAVGQVVESAVDELPWIRRGGRCRQARDGLADVGHADLVRVRGARRQEPRRPGGCPRTTVPRPPVSTMRACVFFLSRPLTVRDGWARTRTNPLRRAKRTMNENERGGARDTA